MNRLFFICLLIVGLYGCKGGSADSEDAGVKDGGIDGGIWDGGVDGGECNPEGMKKVGWVRTFGGPLGEEGKAVAVGPEGEVVVAGEFWGPVDFNPTEGEDLIEMEGLVNTFVSKYSSNGEYIWTRTLQGNIVPGAVGVDKRGDVLVGGDFLGETDFDPGPGVVKKSNLGGGYSDIYILKLDTNGKFEWVFTSRGTESGDVVHDISIDSNDSIVITGKYWGLIDFAPTTMENNHRSKGEWDIFIFKLDREGDLLWSRSIGRGSWDIGNGIAVCPDDTIAVTGTFMGTVDFDPGEGVHELKGNGNDDVFLLKLDKDGNHVWSRSFGADFIDTGVAVDVDGDGNIYVGGDYCHALDFDPTDAGVDEHVPDGCGAFMSKYGPDGEYLWTRTIDGDDSEFVRDIACTPDGVLSTGEFYGIEDFDPGSGVDEHDNRGASAIFLTKIYSDGAYAWTKSITRSGSYGSALSTASDDEGEIFSTGFYKGRLDFDGEECTDEHVSFDEVSRDVFLMKVSKDGTFYKKVREK